jgi:putative glutamine amidotransferase
MSAFDAVLTERPVIGITPEGLDARGNILLPRAYTDAVVRAGGLPLLLVPWGGDAAALLARVDGLILAGGGDLDPALYNGDPAHPAVYEVDPERDQFEIALARLAAAQEVPLLGICRGLQVINVAFGGTLHAHLPDVLDGSVAHRGQPPAYVPHPVFLDPATRLACLMEQMLSVCPLSWHHQGIDIPAPNLAVEAIADDGSIEGIELSGHPFYFGVQWHPEMTAASDATQQRLFDGLVRAAGWRRDPERTPSLNHFWSFDKCVFPTRSP